MRCAVFLCLVPALMGQTVALTDCTLIDPRYGVATAHSSIVITGDRITARGPAAPTRIPPGARIVRASGKFVIPGLWDMHVHVGAIEEEPDGFAGNGSLGGKRTATAAIRTQNVASGRRLGLELFWTLFPMNAPAIDDECQARAEVARRAAMGLTYIKI